MKHSDTNKGFTLIELMLVISIIAILVSILYASFNLAEASGRNAKRAEDSVQLRTALTGYSIDHNGVPAGSAAAGCTAVYNASDVQTSWLCNSTSPQGLSVVLTPLVTGGYISSIPKDPVNSGGLAYYYVSDLQTSTGPGGVALTPDASFRYVAEGSSTSNGNPVVLGTDAGIPDYTAYPGVGYPVAGSGTGGNTVPGTQAPTAPVGFGGVAVPHCPEISPCISFSWSAPANTYGLPVTAYNIYISPANTVVLSTSHSPITYYYPFGTSTTTAYSFYITAVTSAGESAPSSVVVVPPVSG